MNVHIKQDRPRAGPGRGHASFFEHFPRGRNAGIEFAGFKMSAGLKPALQFGVEDEQGFGAIRIEHDAAGGEMAGDIVLARKWVAIAGNQLLNAMH